MHCVNNMKKTTVKGFLGIDNGTQGLSVIFTDCDLKVLATGEATYDFVSDLEEGCYEQRTQDWDEALSQAMKQLRTTLASVSWQILAVGISGQMHGEVLVGDNTATPTQALAPVRLWCDARNADTGDELTALLQTKVPKRSTTARFLWTARNRPDLAAQTRHITTPAGWCAARLTGEWNLGIGDASGMFPMDPVTKTYDAAALEKVDRLLQREDSHGKIPSLATLLPVVKCAGQDAGRLTPAGAALLGLDAQDASKILVAPAEGDQVAALAGSLIGTAGTISCSFGTSVCANAVGDRPFQGVSPSVDQFCATDGAPVNMVWLRNGTTFLNRIVESYAETASREEEDDRKKGAFASIMPQMLAAPADCGGLLALPFMDDEPGLQVHQGGSACIVGWNVDNAKPGNVAKAALLSTMFNLKLGCGVLDRQGYPRTELVLTGGLSKTPECGQILADVFDTPVMLLASADEGSSWGAAVMAKYRYLCSNSDEGFDQDWPSFLQSIMPSGDQVVRFTPNKEFVPVYEKKFVRYQKLVALQSQLAQAVS